MEYTEFIVTVPRTAAQEVIDLATALCGDGLYIEDYADIEEQARAIAHVDLIEPALLQKPRDEVRVHLYASSEENPVAFGETLQSRLLALGLPHTLESRGVKQEDWENSWKQYYHPIEIGVRLAVAPSWEDYQSPRTVLLMDPGMAFGTGTHETTALCLAILDARVKGGEAVLDVGTGSGILAVAALLLGAESALGLDIDPVAVRTAKENAQRNGVAKRFTVFAGDLACVGAGAQPGRGENGLAAHGGGKYDIITANIVAAAILRLAPSVPPLLAPGGIFVASGIIDQRAAEVEEGLAQVGLSLIERHEQRGWVALVAGGI